MRGFAIGVLGVMLGMLAWAVDNGGSVVPAVAEIRSDTTGAPPDHLICPMADFIRSDTRIALMTSRAGTVDLERVGEGSWSSYRRADLGDTGGWVGDVPLGTGMLVAESGIGWSAAGMLNVAPQAISAWMCGESSEMLMALGGSTLAGDRLDLILYNPYVWDSTIGVEIISELGEDTPAELREIYVPAGRAVRVNLDEALRLRRFMGVWVRSSPGKVALLLQQSGNGETAVVEGSMLHSDWWLPVPDLDQAETHLLVSSPSDSSFSYRIDLLTESGPVYSFVEGEFLPGQLTAVPLSDLPDGVTGIRVLGNVAHLAALRIEGDGLLAAGPGALGTSRRWFLPAAAGGPDRRDRAWLLNPLPLPVSATVSGVAEGAFSSSLTIPPESVLPFDLGELTGRADDLAGYLVDAEEEIAVVWTSETEDNAASYTAGVPVD